MSATTDIFSKCVPAIHTNIAQCGLMTVCNAEIPTPSELDTIFKDGSGNYRVMEALFMHQMEMKFCQVRESNLYTFFMANKVDMSHKLNVEMIKTGLARIRPYILVQRQAPINNNYWNASDGAACDADGTLNAGGSYWRLDFLSPTGIPASIAWFNPPERVFITGKTGGGTRTDTAFQVKLAYIVGGLIRVVLTSQNAGSFLTSDQVTLPVSGLAMRGTANVSDFESFCQRPPGLITINEDEFWIETTRDAQCIDDLYIEWRDLIMANNPLYAKFFDLDPVQYNKQSGEDFQRRLVNTAFFNKPINSNQTLANVASLPEIDSVEPGGARCVGRRANAIGILEQHAQVKSYIDLQGLQFNLPAFFKALYTKQRLREDIGAVQTQIFEIGMPSQYFPAFNQAMLQYYKAQSNGMLELHWDVTKEAKVSPLGFVFYDYKVIWPNITLRIVIDRFFDDYLAANTAVGQEAVGRLLWVLDWSKIYIGIMASERVVNKTGILQTLAAVDPTYSCVMRVPSKTVTLMSMTWTLICEAPQANLIFANLSGEPPEAVQIVGNYDTTCNTTTTSTTTAPSSP